MIAVAVTALGLILGSFVNALVWRTHEQAKAGKKASREFSIARGRSMCPHCRHELAAKDLVPVLSWLSLRGKCRYCGKPISPQYPLVELATAALFLLSYLLWDHSNVLLGLWLVLLVGMMALVVYDLRWRLLPDRIVYPLTGVAGVFALVQIATADHPLTAFVNTVLAVAVGGGLFYLIFQLSKGKWIGGGDVKLGWLLGLIAGTPARALLFIFLASVLGSLLSLPLLATHRLKRTSTIPFGPFLIVGAIIMVLFGAPILHWYEHSILLMP